MCTITLLLITVLMNPVSSTVLASDSATISTTQEASGFLLPFQGKWFVVWGGNTKEQNYHIESQNQTGAFDFVIISENGKTYKQSGKMNEDYFAFGMPILSPKDGTVTDVIEGVRDNVLGIKNAYSALGNTIVIQHIDNVFSVLAHLKLGSITVRVGDQVKSGEVIAQCGNSGHSSEPHLHFHLQDNVIIPEGIGIKCFFSKIILERDGKTEVKTNYSPIKSDIISNLYKE
ncbi:M23 family metallopeptidase [Candidatus Latescibacterota bacterium]